NLYLPQLEMSRLFTKNQAYLEKCAIFHDLLSTIVDERAASGKIGGTAKTPSQKKRKCLPD
ncbi:MAG: hypothetical protein SOY69_02205, partial [Alloprevotella sp.]|nr:hypothetical protein [Alloprevotella sp.]